MDHGDQGQMSSPVLPVTQAQAIPPLQQQHQQSEAASAAFIRPDSGPPLPLQSQRGTSQSSTTSSGEKSHSEQGTHASQGLLNDPAATRGRFPYLHWTIPMSQTEGEEEDDIPLTFPDPRTVGARLKPTLKIARREKKKYERRAKWNGMFLNIALGLQLLLGALVTGLSAAVSPKHVGLTTSILGGMSTLVASYLARMRGSNEPQQSISKAQALDQFIRKCEAHLLDYGFDLASGEDEKVRNLREKLEGILGNQNDEQQLPTGGTKPLTGALKPSGV